MGIGILCRRNSISKARYEVVRVVLFFINSGCEDSRVFCRLGVFIGR